MDMHSPLKIGEAARQTGVSAKMIRHYESLGLLPAVARRDNGYRMYSAQDLRVLGFIRRARGLGFSMAEIAELVGLWNNPLRASAEVKKIAQAHIDELDKRMDEIAAMKDSLAQLVQACPGNAGSKCSILDGLAPPAEARG